MPARPAWNGHLRLSLVTAPCALYKATEAAKRGVSFNYLNPETNSRIAMKVSDPTTGEEVMRSDLVKGYQVDKGLFVRVTDDELRALKIDSDGALQIDRFVPDADIDRLFWGEPYYLVPDGPVANEPFAVIREAMRTEGQVALARVVMNGRERQFALEPRGRGIVAHALRTHAEVRNEADYFDRLPDTAPDPAMVSIAKQILQQHAGPFDPREFVDSYQAAVMALIERKKAEQGVVRQGSSQKTAPSEAQIVDLMAALKASLGAPSGRRKRSAAAATATSRQTASKRRKTA